MDKDKLLELMLYSIKFRSSLKWLEDRVAALSEEQLGMVSGDEASQGIRAAFSATKSDLENVERLLKELDIIV